MIYRVAKDAWVLRVKGTVSRDSLTSSIFPPFSAGVVDSRVVPLSLEYLREFSIFL